MTAFLVSILVLNYFGQTSLVQGKQRQCAGSSISNRYTNYAEGFSIAIPRGYQGRRGQAAGPERSVSIPLSHDCAGVVVVYGEPNSLEWSRPAEAISWKIDTVAKGDSQAEVRRYTTRLGNLKAAAVTVRHSATSEVEEFVVAFRPGGGPVYMAMLSTTETRYKQDSYVFRKVLRGFRLTAWR
jgi:hypothetical protein